MRKNKSIAIADKFPKRAEIHGIEVGVYRCRHGQIK